MVVAMYRNSIAIIFIYAQSTCDGLMILLITAIQISKANEKQPGYTSVTVSCSWSNKLTSGVLVNIVYIHVWYRNTFKLWLYYCVVLQTTCMENIWYHHITCRSQYQSVRCSDHTAAKHKWHVNIVISIVISAALHHYERSNASLLSPWFQQIVCRY